MLTVQDIPENILLEIFRYLTIKELCVICRVCRSWRRIGNDKAVWKHVDMTRFKLNLKKMWKIIRAHFSDVLLSLHLRGYHTAGSANLMKNSLSEAMMKDLKERCPNVRELELIENHFTEVPLEAFPSKLKILRLKSCYVPSGWFKRCHEYLPMLELLDLSDSNKTSDSDMKDISQCKTLAVLQINGCYRVGPPGLENIAMGNTNLKELHICGVKCSDLALHHIGRNLKLLQSLNLSGTKEKRNTISDGAFVGSVTMLSQLQTLDLSYSSLTDEALLEFYRLKNLKSLAVSFSETTKIGIQKFKEEFVSKGGSRTVTVIANHIVDATCIEGSVEEATLEYA